MKNPAYEYLENQKKKFSSKNKTNLPYMQRDNLDFLIQAQNQGYLFHGSRTKRLLTELTPFQSNLDANKVVFAGKLWAGISFIGDWDDSDLVHGTKDEVPYILPRHKNALDVLKTPGWLYLVPPTSFKHTDKLARFEFVSYDNIIPDAAVWVKDPFKHLKELGVRMTE